MPYVRWTTRGAGVRSRAPRAGALGQPRGIEWGGREAGDSGWRAHKYTYDRCMLMDGKNHHNSVIIFQLKLINFKMNKNKQIP